MGFSAISSSFAGVQYSVLLTNVFIHILPHACLPPPPALSPFFPPSLPFVEFVIAHWILQSFCVLWLPLFSSNAGLDSGTSPF